MNCQTDFLTRLCKLLCSTFKSLEAIHETRELVQSETRSPDLPVSRQSNDQVHSSACTPSESSCLGDCRILLQRAIAQNSDVKRVLPAVP